MRAGRWGCDRDRHSGGHRAHKCNDLHRYIQCPHGFQRLEGFGFLYCKLKKFSQ